MQTIEILSDFIKKYWPWIVGVAAIALLIGALAMGWRVNLNGISRSGALVLNGLPAQTEVYVDQTRREARASDTAHVYLSEGTHAAIVSAPGYYPWDELVSVVDGKETAVSPIFVPKEPRKGTITDQSNQQFAIQQALGSQTKEHPLLIGECMSIYVVENRVVAAPGTDCTPPPYLCSSDGACSETVIFSSSERLRRVIAYPGRNDALIISAGRTVFVLEIDPHAPQFYAPLYEGRAPRAVWWGEKSIAVIDGADFVEVSL